MKEKFKIKKTNKLLIISLLIISSFAYFHVCQATFTKEVVDFVFGWFFELLTAMAGGISVMVINGIIGIASYNGFINQPQIIEAWKIVRDFCNMFFILILLVIAFASILRLENYSMKRWLPKVVIMAVLINFSRTIVGVLIDASQIVMLTFVNAFVGTGSNFVGVLQIKEFLTSMSNSSALTAPEIAKGYAFATIFLIVSVIVLLAILVVLVMRVIFLWIYVALSPLAFLMMAFPGGQKYASQYWGDFTKYLINGPVLAFFIWLALSTMQEGVTIEGLNINIQSGSTAIMNADSFMSFILAIAFMVGGLMMSSQIGGMGASWGSGMVSKVKNTGMGWAKKPVNLGWRGVKSGAMTGLNYGVDKLQKTGIVDLNVKRGWNAMQARRKEKKAEDYSAGMENAQNIIGKKGRFRGLLARTANPGDAYEAIMSAKGRKEILKGGANMEKDKNEALGELKTLTERRENSWSQEEKEKNDEEIKAITKENTTEDFDRKIKNLDESLKKDISDEYRDSLMKEREKLVTNRDYLSELIRKQDNKKVINTEQREDLDGKIKKLKETVRNNTLMYGKESRMAGEAMVNKKMAQLNGIDDSGELIAMLREAIGGHDKNMIKAILKKLTKNGDANEAFLELAGRTDYKGVQKLMNDFSDEKSDLYAGFDQQEAYALGADVSYLARGANHWAMTGSYKMKNGQWDEMDEKENLEYRDAEVGKMHTQDIFRKLNRLAHGAHVKNADGSVSYELDAAGLLTILKKMDNQTGIENMRNLNESAAKHLRPYIQKLHEKGKVSEEFFKAFEVRAKHLTGNIDRQYKEAKENLEEINE